ncbi:hypothetical protein NVP1031O_174 [Vibrio phage 1.031.O._10N.261.46.F8]|nr:hypothetical protein NVP1031O_174 [Vibrio phage 1.031.O._10N.261.46.F8]
MSQKVYIVSRLNYSETIKVGPDKLDNVRISPRGRIGPFNLDDIQKDLPRGITTNPAAGV